MSVTSIPVAATAGPVPTALGRPELLSPAGDWECARAAVENGADAIYFGLDKFNARMRANNFTTADLPKLMEFLRQPISEKTPLNPAFDLFHTILTQKK